MPDCSGNIGEANSRLIYLEPLGVGTPMVESILSYMYRLAQVHSIKPGHLIDHELLHLMETKTKTKNRMPSKRKPKLDPVGRETNA